VARDVIVNMLFGMVIPLAALAVIGVPFREMGLAEFPSAFGRFSQLTWSLALAVTAPLTLFHPRLRTFYFSRTSWTRAPPAAVVISFAYSWFVAGVPEEFLFRQLL